MALLICTATGRELHALAPTLFPETEHLPELSLLETPETFARREDVFFFLTGVGPINAALAMGLCLGQLRQQNIDIQTVINTGLVGAYNLEKIPLRSCCLVREEIWPEYGLHDGRSVTAQAFSWPLWTPDTSKQATPIYDRIQLADLQSLGLWATFHASEFLPTTSLSVAGVSASVDRALDLWNRYHADLENMEGFAVAYACARFNIPCVEIRCVANKVGPRRKDEKDFAGALEQLGTILPKFNLI